MEGLDLECVSLKSIDPLHYDFKLKVKFDRPFKREWMRSFGPNRTPVKETVSLDVVLYDQEGTTMVFRLITEDQRARMAWLFHEGREFNLCNPVVETGGLGIHERYHLVANHTTHLWPTCDVVFPPFPYKLKSCVDIAMGKCEVKGIFDVVGWARIANPTTFMKSNCDWEPEMRIILGVHHQELGWLNYSQVICIVRGDFVEEFGDLIDPSREDKVPPPFVQLRYVEGDEPYSSGTKVVRCVAHASRLKINPDIPEVQSLKQGMLDLDFID